MTQQPDAAGWAGLEVLVLAPTPTHPQDFGNRKRIYEVCRGLQRRGARITYLHYPGEGDWRRDLPQASWQGMREAWEDCHVVPVTQELHPPARGIDHTIDEWWDPAIGAMLTWLFRVRRFDVMIVNYAWLSRAFEFAPPDVLKILDTHDRFSGRRDLLASLGIAPEFFHTTVEQERIALDRADLVWSIKADEAVYFRTLTRVPVLNLPHAAPIEAPLRPRPGRFLRFGIVGAMNNINLFNFRGFLAALHEEVRRTLLPCEVRIGGSICGWMERDRLPGYVTLAGAMPDLTEFYRSVDVVLAPVAVSTGLKIKVAEALALGKPMIAHAHAFEGFPAQHPFQVCADFPAMVAAMAVLVNHPGQLPELEVASVRVAIEMRAEFDRSLDDTIVELRRIPRGVVVVLDAEDLVPGSLVADHVREAATYVGHQARVNIFIGGDGSVVPSDEALARLAGYGTPVLAPALYARAGARACEVMAARMVHAAEFAALAAEEHLAFWFAGRPRRWTGPGRCRAPRAYVSFEGFVQSTPAQEFPAFVDTLRAGFAEVVVLSRADSVPVAAALALPGVRGRRVPPLWRGEHSPSTVRLRKAERDGILILADSADDPLVTLVSGMCAELAGVPARVAVPRDPAFVPGGDAPALVLDLAVDPGLDGVRDLLDHIGAPRIVLFKDGARPAGGAWVDRHGASGLFESVAMLAGALARLRGGEAPLLRRRGQGYADDAGWAFIWGEIGALAAE